LNITKTLTRASTNQSSKDRQTA